MLDESVEVFVIDPRGNGRLQVSRPCPYIGRVCCGRTDKEVLLCELGLVVSRDWVTLVLARKDSGLLSEVTSPRERVWNRDLFE